ncbi:hypothetical protein BDN72DRAFT_836127 [Pluteus cervinus]|uniref:Uncharacterized protein n=1 Tax=Pluteus cervinus TaxID=181527 RepID=A0ACD3B6F5_9AGAR|nr:hypothetical protein BDN72DRAFT_836127 [Pluteus cervinus]
MHNVTKLFVTHMHADHIMGITTFLRNSLFPPPTDVPLERSSKPAKVEIYGPAGIRNFVRSNLTMTFSRCSENYVVHELLAPTDSPTSCELGVLHINELPGQDIFCSEDGFWRNITNSSGYYGPVSVDAGPIAHRDPCIGYIFHETFGPMRKVVILGDTHDPSHILPLCQPPPGSDYPPPSLLIHEATDAHIPRYIDPRAKRPSEVIKEKALARGHSLPEMAGTFAKTINAQRLILNHIGSR